MLKPLLLTLLAACGVEPPTESPATASPDLTIEAPEDEPPEQLFCCQSVNPRTWSGDGCAMVATEHVALCGTAILFCHASWTLSDGTATCLK